MLEILKIAMEIENIKERKTNFNNTTKNYNKYISFILNKNKIKYIFVQRAFEKTIWKATFNKNK